MLDSLSSSPRSRSDEQDHLGELGERVELVPVSRSNLGAMRSLNAVLFPITYSENFYSTILHQSTGKDSDGERVVRLCTLQVFSTTLSLHV